jgi:hypothetical protein
MSQQPTIFQLASWLLSLELALFLVSPTYELKKFLFKNDLKDIYLVSQLEIKLRTLRMMSPESQPNQDQHHNQE